MEQKFEDIIRTIFYESMDSRFTEEEEINEYIKEKTEECMEIAREEKMNTKEAIEFVEWAKDVFHVCKISKEENIEFIKKGNAVIKFLQKNKKSKVVAWEKELDKYIETNEHKFQCASWSEGLECCLEKKWIRDFIRRLLC